MTTASIVVHKSPESQLRKVMECLENSSVDVVYIIDNSPSSNLRGVAETFKKAEYLHIENNGFGAGHNIAIRKAIERNSNFHLVLNADIWWQGDIIEKIKQFMDSNPDVGVLSPKTFYPDGSLQYTCRMLPTPLDMWLRAFLPEKFSRKRMDKYLLKNHNHDRQLNCPYLLGSFMFFRIEALKNIGLFDERFFMYPEDIDITRRIHEKYQTLFWPDVSIVHEHQRASRKNLKMFWIHFSNMVRYFNKWGWWKDNKRKLYNKKVLVRAEEAKYL